MWSTTTSAPTEIISANMRRPFSARTRRRRGAMRSTCAKRASANSSSPTRCTGSTNIASTDCASTPCTPSSIRTGCVDLAARVRTHTDGRHAHLVLEHDGNAASLLTHGFDAQWDDDFHHVMHTLLTGERGGYYSEYADSADRNARARVARRFRLARRSLAVPRRRRARRTVGASAADVVRRIPAEPRPDRQPRLRRAAYQR